MFWGPTKAEMEKKDKELRANVTMTEHLTDLDELMATFQTNLTTASIHIFSHEQSTEPPSCRLLWQAPLRAENPLRARRRVSRWLS